MMFLSTLGIGIALTFPVFGGLVLFLGAALILIGVGMSPTPRY